MDIPASGPWPLVSSHHAALRLDEVTAPHLAVRITPQHGGRCRVLVRGEIDLDVAPEFARALAAALRASTTGVDVVMTQVSFCDCRGLNALLTVRLLAQRAGKTLVLARISPQVRRLLDLTDIADLLTGDGRFCPDQVLAAARPDGQPAMARRRGVPGPGRRAPSRTRP